MIEGRPSRTALGVAMRCAAHQLLDRPLVFEDSVALRILGPRYGERLRADLLTRHRTRTARLLRAFLVVRSRLAEDLLAEAVAAGVTRYVVLGAGLDTFAYRNPFPGLRVFEVDFPATQAWKREMLAQAGIAVPESLTFAPCDFARQSAADALAAAGVDAAQPVFCSWLGVTMYLERDAVLATVRSLMPFIRAPGGLVFDYLVPVSTLPFTQRMLFRLFGGGVRRRVARAGEPFIADFTPTGLEAAIRSLGGRDVADYAPQALTDRYLGNRPDGLRIGRIGHMLLVRG